MNSAVLSTNVPFDGLLPDRLVAAAVNLVYGRRYLEAKLEYEKMRFQQQALFISTLENIALVTNDPNIQLQMFKMIYMLAPAYTK